jgi:uncharacterized protein (TIGR02284 family)
MSASSRDVVSQAEMIATLQRLIDASRDAEKGYKLAAVDITDPAMKTLLLGHSKQRSGFAAELEECLREAGGRLQKRNARGTLRGWVEVRAALPSRSDRMILEECDRGETVSRKTYDAAMQDVPLASMPAPARVVVQRQYGALLAAQSEIRKVMWEH